MAYPADRVSLESLEVIFANECNLNETSLTARRFRRVANELEAATISLSDAIQSERKRCLEVIPSTWLDPMLTGETAIIGEPPYTCADVELICRAIRDRIETPK